MTRQISPGNKSDYDELVEVWEASVRATHDFVTEEDILLFRTMVRSYFELVDLYLIRDDHKIVGFLGTGGEEVQMLFLHPDARGKGLGRVLMEFAITEQKARKVEVNEQNHHALGFYKHMGFKIVSRSNTDGNGRPYPVLSMELSRSYSPG